MIGEQPYIIPPIDINASKKMSEELFSLYKTKLDILRKEIEDRDIDLTPESIIIYDWMIEFYILSAKVSQKTEYPKYPQLEEELMSVIHGKFQALDKLEKNGNVIMDMYKTKLQIDQRTLFYTISVKDEEYTKVLKLQVSEYNDIISDPKSTNLQKHEARYDREIKMLWLSDFEDFKGKIYDKGRQDRNVMLAVYKKKIDTFGKLNDILTPYVRELFESVKHEKDIILAQKNVIKAIKLKYLIAENIRLIGNYKNMSLDNPITCKSIRIQQSEAYKYFDQHIDEFNAVIAAKEKIISELTNRLVDISYLDKINAHIEILNLRSEVQAHKRYTVYFEQRKFIIP